MAEKLSTKVTNINDRYHIRLLNEDNVINEMACELKLDIGWCCREMLRWHQKLGGNSKMAEASRNRQKKKYSPKRKSMVSKPITNLIGEL